MSIMSALERAHATISSGVDLNEHQIRQVAVLPILRELGWDDLNPLEVFAELTLPQSGRVDFALCDTRGALGTALKPLVFIETKRVARLGESATEHEKAVNQLFGYASNRGVPIVILTDGVSWEFYLSMAAGPPGERIFYQIDLRRPDDHPEYAENFTRYLDKHAVITGTARRSAEEDLDSNAAKEQARRSIPVDWQSLITNDGLRDLLADAVAEESGRKPDLDDIEEFLQSLSISTNPEHPATSPPSHIEETGTHLPTPPPPRRKIVGFVLDGQPFTVNAGYLALAGVLKEFQRRDAGFLQRLAPATRGSRNYLVARNPHDIFADQGQASKKTMDLENGWWMRTNHSNRDIEGHVQTACHYAQVSFGSQCTITYG